MYNLGGDLESEPPVDQSEVRLEVNDSASVEVEKKTLKAVNLSGQHLIIKTRFPPVKTGLTFQSQLLQRCQI